MRASLVRRLSLTPSPIAAVAVVVAALCTLAPGCGGETDSAGAAVVFDPCAPLALVLDPQASAAQAQGIADGLALWNARAQTRLSVVSAPPAPGAAAVPVHFQGAAAPFHGLYDPGTGQVFINDDLADHQRMVAVAHEVGHAFGLKHVSTDERASLMNAGNLDVDPTAADADALAGLWGRCPP
jgi:hypothetical protein